MSWCRSALRTFHHRMHHKIVFSSGAPAKNFKTIEPRRGLYACARRFSNCQHIPIGSVRRCSTQDMSGHYFPFSSFFLLHIPSPTQNASGLIDNLCSVAIDKLRPTRRHINFYSGFTNTHTCTLTPSRRWWLVSVKRLIYEPRVDLKNDDSDGSICIGFSTAKCPENFLGLRLFQIVCEKLKIFTSFDRS